MKLNLAVKRKVSEVGALKTKVTNLEGLMSQLQTELDKARKRASENEKQSANAIIALCQAWPKKTS